MKTAAEIVPIVGHFPRLPHLQNSQLGTRGYNVSSEQFPRCALFATQNIPSG